MKNHKNNRDLQKLPEDGITFEVEWHEALLGYWCSKFSIIFLWLYSFLRIRGLRLIGQYLLKKAFFFANGKIPVSDEKARRRTVNNDMENLNRDIDLD